MNAPQEQPQEQTVSLSGQQMAQAANAGINLLNLGSTLIPGNIKQQISMLEMILTGVADGQLVIVSRPQAPVESVPEGEVANGLAEDVTDLTGSDDADTDQTPS